MKAATVVSTKEFDSTVKGLLGEDELATLEFSVATNPTAHPVIPGTDGVRKMRFARPGMGKRGGVRVIYFYAISAEVVVLLSAYAKNEKENLSNEDKKNLRHAVEVLKKPSDARSKTTPLGRSIVRGLEEAAAWARSDIELRTRMIHVPDEVDVGSVRAKSGLSQTQFAERYGFNPRTLQEWEQGRSRPDSAVRAYLTVIDRNPEAVTRAPSKAFDATYHVNKFSCMISIKSTALASERA